MKILIIGASRGIGLELVRQYVAEGAAVTGTARDEAGLARVRALGATALPLDLADRAAPLPGDGQVFDVVVLSAGVYGPRTRGLQTPAETEFDAVMHVNVLGAMRVLPQLEKAFAPGA